LESDEDDDAISIKIRLATVNDESKWEFNPDKPISKLISRVASHYGIAANLLVFKFDGERMQDMESLNSLGIEDEDLIDAQVRSSWKGFG
jgi:hypothetical protein